MPNETETLANEVRGIIKTAGRLKASLEEIGFEQPLYGEGGLGLHSIDVFDIVTEVETRFKVEIPDEEIPKLNSVSAIVRFIEARQHA